MLQEVLLSQMKRCLKNHEQYINRQRKKATKANPNVNHNALMAAMSQEMAQQTPSVSVLNSLLISCRKKRQDDARRATSAVKHLRDYPALQINQLVNEIYSFLSFIKPDLTF